MNEKRHAVTRFHVVSYALLHHRKTILITKFRGSCGTRAFEHDRNSQQKFGRSHPLQGLIRTTLCQSKINMSNRNVRVRGTFVAY